ncbi:MAG: hypothetical protein WCO00_12685 [Rhodospirillaceae bacterium]
MRRLVVYLMVGLLALATAAPPGFAQAQEPWQEPPPVRIQTRDISPYLIGLGAIMGMIAFNIAAPPVSAWFGSAMRSVTNIRSVIWAASRVAAGGTAPAAAAAAAASVPPAAGTTAAAAAAATGPVVSPLTQTMMAQAQITGTAAAAAGAAVVSIFYKLFNWITGAAP